MKILDINHIEGTLLIHWETEDIILNHAVPEEVRMNPAITKERILALLEAERPDPRPDPVWVKYEDVPVNLRALKFTDRPAEIRSMRDNLLRGVVDSVNAIRWDSFTEDEKTAWREYRQKLLDIPQHKDFPWWGKEVPWPQIPAR